MSRLLILTVVLSFLLPISAVAQFGPPPSNPVVHMDGASVRKLADIPNGGNFVNRHPIRIAKNPVDGGLYVLATSQPDGRNPGSTNLIYRLDPTDDGTFDLTTMLEGEDHEAPRPVGMAFGPDGTLYIVGNAEVGTRHTQIVIRRGTPSGSGWEWSTVATSEPYLFSLTYFDHRANAIAVTPDGSSLIINSGSRTDHGEMYDGVRDEGITSILLKVPADATDLELPNDREALRAGGYLYAEGIRNTADLAFAPNGDLFGPENAGDRDDPGELNWLIEGGHYGFPWRIGGNETPQQFPDYDPANDPLVPARCNPNNADTGCYFGNDPTYPPPPEGVTFIEPLANPGPYADSFLDPITGRELDASDEDTVITTFSGGRSPLGLVFDADSVLEGRLKGGAFMLSFAGAMGGFPSDGQDMVFLDLEKTDDGYTLSTESVVTGFTHPIDAEMIGNVVYVIEYGDWFSSGGTRGVWAVTLPTGTNTSVEPDVPQVATQLDVYPNPTSAELTVDYEFGVPGPVRIEMIDLLGRVVKTIQDDSGGGRTTLSTSELAPGLYIVRVTSGTMYEARSVTVVR